MHPQPHSSTSGSSPPSRDPFAVMLGNASLLGVGYALLGLWGRAVATVTVTIGLLLLLGLTDGPGWWFQGALLLWWGFGIAYGWLLASGRLGSSAVVPAPAPDSRFIVAASVDDPDDGPKKPRSLWGQRLLALGVTGAVFVSFALLRVDAWRIEQAADEAHLAGKCTNALSQIDSLWFGHRLADAPLTERVEAAEPACKLLRRARNQGPDQRLRAGALLKQYVAHPEARWDGATDLRADVLLAEADDNLEAALRTGDARELDDGFDLLSTVLDEIPGRGKDTHETLGRFLEALPTKDACNTAGLTGRMDDRLSSGDDLDGALAVVAKVEPKAIVDCGDDLLADDIPRQARDRYRQLLDKYPEHKQKKRAKAGVTEATHAIQLTNIRQLLTTAYAGKPDYCGNPAPYGGAEPYKGDGPHPALIYGPDTRQGKLPSSWKADGPGEAVLVICTGEPTYGTVVETCPYEDELSLRGYSQVDFAKREIPVTVYEVRTGKVVKNTSIQIDGESCPQILKYETYIADTGPPSEVYVKNHSKADVREAYEDLIKP